MLFALIEAEEHGVTRDNVRTLVSTTGHPAVQRLLGGTTVGNALGVRHDWVVRVVGSVGNYGEMFERHRGPQSALRLERGLNRLWTQGGVMSAPPWQ